MRPLDHAAATESCIAASDGHDAAAVANVDGDDHAQGSAYMTSDRCPRLVSPLRNLGAQAKAHDSNIL